MTDITDPRFDRIIFKGEWSTPEQETITRAIELSNRRQGAALWICNRLDWEDGQPPLYIASRTGSAMPLWASSPEALAERIRQGR